MATVPPSELSRYMIGAEIELEDGTLIQIPPEPVRPLGLNDDIIHTVSLGDTLFTIAAKYYEGMRRPSQFYWAIADYQDLTISDVLLPLEEGRQIRVPSRRTLQEIILNEARHELSLEMLITQLGI